MKMLIDLKNKKGADKVLAVYWIMILIITAGGIFGMVYTFYNHPYDVRTLEAEVLTNKIADCLSYGGEINSEIFSDSGFNRNFENEFLKVCHLNLKTSLDSAGEITEFYVDVNIYGSENLNQEVFSFESGNKGLVAGCNIQDEKEFEKEVKCFEEEFFSFVSGEGTQTLYLIKIKSIVKKSEQNVKS